MFSFSNLWDPTSVAESEECAENQNKGALADVGRSVATLSCIQLQVLRKLALLKLTAHMEKYCPSHRTGWNWELPKFIRKIKAPAYKGKPISFAPIAVLQL